MLQFTEKFEPVKILQLLSKGLPYYLESWHDIDERNGIFGNVEPKSFNMRAMGLSSPVIEYVLRPHINILCVLSGYVYLNQYGIAGHTIGRFDLIDKLHKGLEWVCSCHVTGNRDVDAFLDRRRWGENWHSSLWASMLGVIAVLAEPVLDDGEQTRIREIVAHEADRFIGVMPPSGGGGDSRAEDNAQDSMLLAWAINICPHHPHNPDWAEALKIWAVNTGSSVHDSADHSEYFGSSVAKAVVTCNLHPDFTAEEHGFFHPNALSYGAWTALAMAAYGFQRREPPAYLSRNKSQQQTFDILARFCMPNGMLFAPGGHDMPLFIPRPMALAWGHWNCDPRALHMTGKLLTWMDALTDANPGERVPWIFGFEPTRDGWELLFQSQVGAELAMMACMPFPKEQRTFSAGQLENAVDTRQIYPYVELCYRRNVRSTRSVAWKAIGGHPLIGLQLHSCPELMAPFKAALLGVPSVSDPVKSAQTLFHNDRYLRDGFDTSGRIAYMNADGQKILTRDIRAITWGEEGIVVFDQITANTDLTINEQYLSPIYVVNDRWTGGTIDLVSGSYKDTIRSDQRKYRELPCPAFWANINNQLLYQFLWGRNKGLYYLPGGERNAPPYWKNCRLDMLATHVEAAAVTHGHTVYRSGFYIGGGKAPKLFKTTGTPGEFFKGLVVMDGKITMGLD
jgi:hypothetical protein